MAFVDVDRGVEYQPDSDIDYWSEIEDLYGSTVRFVPAPDIANDRSRTNGTVTLERTGSGQLTVKLRYATATDMGSDPGRFGTLAEFNADYTLKTSSGQTITQNSDGSFDVFFDHGVGSVTGRWASTGFSTRCSTLPPPPLHRSAVFLTTDCGWAWTGMTRCTVQPRRCTRVQFVGWSNTQPSGSARKAVYGY